MRTPIIEAVAGGRRPQVMIWPRRRLWPCRRQRVVLQAGLAIAVSAAFALAAPAGLAAATVSSQGHPAGGDGLRARSVTAGTGWSVVPTPNPTVPTGQLLFGTCASASSCVAVGTYVTATGRGVTLAEQWNGTRWVIQPTPNPASAKVSALAGVACATPSACTAVGYAVTSSGASTPLAERWNGTSWTIQPTPNPAQGGGALFGVACSSPSACTAVGTSSAGTLAERWTGTSWAIQPTPNPRGAQGNVLFAVACPSSSACTSLGFSHGLDTPLTMAQQWNGTSWHLQATPNPTGAAESTLSGVACPARSACVAVGTGANAALAERWNGTTWRIQPVPTRPGAALNAVSCPSASACLAVGGSNSGTLAEQWNGTTWRIQPVPTLPGAALSAVSCPSASACLAVGGSNSGTLAERWNGTRWTILATPNPAGAVQVFLDGVSCLSPSFCMATGAYFTSSSPSGPARSLAEQWNGHKWTILATPNPRGARQAFLGGISCTSVSACTADGEQHSATGIVHTLAERWNGTAWRIQPTPNPPGAPFASLAGLDCTGPSVCTAVGPTLTSLGWVILAERWNGATWRIQPTPALAAAHNMNVPAVACPARTACITVGGYENDGPGSVTLAEQWHGGSTAPRASMAPAGPGSACGLPSLVRAGIEKATSLTPSPWPGLRTATPTGTSAAALPLLTWCRTR